MRNLFWIIGVVILFVIQLAIGESFAVAPNLVLMYLSIMLLYFRLRQVLAAGILAGVFLDYFSGSPDGVMVVSVLVALAGAYFFCQMFFHDRLTEYLPVFYALFSSILFVLAFVVINLGLFMAGWANSPDWRQILSSGLIIHVILNMVFLYPVFWFYQFQAFVQNKLLKTNDSV